MPRDGLSGHLPHLDPRATDSILSAGWQVPPGRCLAENSPPQSPEANDKAALCEKSHDALQSVNRLLESQRILWGSKLLGSLFSFQSGVLLDDRVLHLGQRPGNFLLRGGLLVFQQATVKRFEEGLPGQDSQRQWTGWLEEYTAFNGCSFMAH